MGKLIYINIGVGPTVKHLNMFVFVPVLGGFMLKLGSGYLDRLGNIGIGIKITLGI